MELYAALSQCSIMDQGHQSRYYKSIILAIVFVITAALVIAMQSANLPTPDDASGTTTSQMPTSATPTLLSDPFLQLPTASTVNVVWFTEFEGTAHTVEYGENLTVTANTTQLSRTREDSDSQVQGRAYPDVTNRPIWRHEATVTALQAGSSTPYRVVSINAEGNSVASDTFTLSAAPASGQPLTILLTSDHQLKPMTPANLQKAEETAGRIDAVFFAGDLVNIPDRASEWFDNAEGLALFPGLQGRADYDLKKADTTTRYMGARLIQNAPLFPIPGNHEVMGRYSKTAPLKAQFKNTLPRQLVDKFYPAPQDGTAADSWIADHSYNTQTYEEIFSLPMTQRPDGSETSTYYATTFGDVRLVSLYVTQIWRSPTLTPDATSRYREAADALSEPETWGHGQHIFEDIRKGSPQYQWLEQELASDEFQQAKYKIVMLHHPPHSLGGNVVPPFTDPVTIENRAPNGTLQSIQYDYPPADDYIIRDLIPLLESANVQLVFFGHSHLWNRFVSSSGMHFLETSNVGNSYGAHVEGELESKPRAVPTPEKISDAGDLIPFPSAYSALGDPNGLSPVVPTIAPLIDPQGQPMPYIASNDITCFTLFDTATGTLSSYYFDTRQPDSDVVKFDEFTLEVPQSLSVR